MFTTADVLIEVHKEFPQLKWCDISNTPAVSLALSPSFIIKGYDCGSAICICVYCKSFVVGDTHVLVDANEENRLLLGRVIDRLNHWLGVYMVASI